MRITVYGINFELTSDLAIRVFTAKAEVEQYAKDAFADYHTAKYPHDVSELMRDVEYAYESDPIYQYKDIIEDMYWELDYIESDAYRKAYNDKFRAFEREHVHGTIFVGDDEDYGFYSDWHKDMYGYRPHFITKIVSKEEWAE